MDNLIKMRSLRSQIERLDPARDWLKIRKLDTKLKKRMNRHRKSVMEKIMERTITLDFMEQHRIKRNKKLAEDGHAIKDIFEHKGESIHNPYLSSCNQFEVDPIAEYGNAYIEWYGRECEQSG